MKFTSLSLDILEPLIESKNIENINIERVKTLFQVELGNSPFLPDGQYQIDPRN